MKRTKQRNPAKLSVRQKRSRGRPPKYSPDFHPQAAKKFCEMGATIDQLADAFGVAISTIYQWQNTYPDFFESCRLGNETANARVERSYYERAVGYERDAVKIFMPANAKKPVYAPYREHVPAEPRCGEFWMTRRNPEKWGKDTAAGGDDPIVSLFRKLFSTVETKRAVEEDPRFLIEVSPEAPVTIEHEPLEENEPAEITPSKTETTDE
jgi:transposase-like protein